MVLGTQVGTCTGRGAACMRRGSADTVHDAVRECECHLPVSGPLDWTRSPAWL